jgi:hypothetical protein
VRAHGRVETVPDAGPADHVCWVYDGAPDLDAAAGRFLGGGLARGERLLVVGDGMIEALHRNTLPFGGTDELLATGALQVLDLSGACAETPPLAPEQQLTFFDAAIRQAVDDGFTGLRVAAEVSALAADPETRPALVRYEHLADDLMARGSGFTALCAYRGDLCPEALSEVASVHPLVRAPEGVPPFQVFHDGNGVVLTGSVDTFTAGRLGSVLAESPATVLDIGRLSFIDVAGCRALATWAQGLDRPVEVTGASRLLQRVWRLLALDQLAPVDFTAARA